MNKAHVKIGIVGAGGWGTALASLLAESGCQVKLWTHESEVANEINFSNTNQAYLPGVSIDPGVVATTEPSDLDSSELIVNAVPSQYIRHVYNDYPLQLIGKPVVNLAKGIETHSLLRVSEIFATAFDVPSDMYSVLTGPSHAEEVSRKIPTTVVVASKSEQLASFVQDAFTTPEFRVYTSEDVIGCEFGGSLKNIIAIAAGIIDGIGLGDNTKAALITRGLAEISRLGIALGADSLTFSGLSGLGDLFVTCNSRHSRNRKAGELIGKGFSLDDVLKSTKTVAEGIYTTESAYSLGKAAGVEMPITAQVYRIIFEGLQPVEAIKELMVRKSRQEWEKEGRR